ncbi:MAG: lectin-like protein [Gemmatimonadota bacterium]|jgi:hypothetical protein
MRVQTTLSTIFVAVTTVSLIACGGGGAGDDMANGVEEDAQASAASTYQAVVVPEGITWEEAKQRAEASGGHLVVVSSAEENAAVHGLIADNPEIWVNIDATMIMEGEENPIQVSLGPWIGLYQPPGSSEPAGGWTWVTGETTDYDNWLSDVVLEGSEPNNLGGVEHFAHFFGQGLDNRADTWNDAANDVAVEFTAAGIEVQGELHNPRGYIIEMEP